LFKDIVLQAIHGSFVLKLSTMFWWFLTKPWIWIRR